MARRFFSAVLAMNLIVFAVFFMLFWRLDRQYSAANLERKLGAQLVTLNRITQLSDRLRENPQDAKSAAAMKEELAGFDIARAADGLSAGGSFRPFRLTALLLLLCCAALSGGVCLYLYLRILRPFARLNAFAGEVAAGNLDSPLFVGRGNVFGAFTWAFDLMRSQLKAARIRESEALLAKKALVATISHDIKTPVASIRAYAEALTSGLARTEERRARYLDVIVKKADEVARLTDDLFLHAVSDMDKLSIEPRTYRAPALLGEILDPFFAQYGDRIRQKNAPPDLSVSTDARRLSQVFENLITNASKYAPDSEIGISYKTGGGLLFCDIEDCGGGIDSTDLPFVFDKFYRGKNVREEKGSGLGLYIVRYIMEKTDGCVRLENTGHGLRVTVGIKISAI